MKWIRSIGPHHVSIFGLPHSIHNHVQQFNQELNLSVNQFTISKALEAITLIATKTYARIHKQHLQKPTNNETATRRELPKSGRTKKSQNNRIEIINDATQQWIRTSVHLRSPLHFLQLSSHCIDDEIFKSNTIVEDTSQIPHLGSKLHSYPKSSQIKDTVNEELSVSRRSSSDHKPSASSKAPSTMNTNRQSNNVVQPNLNISKNSPQIQEMPNLVVRQSSDPPPLAYFPKTRRIISSHKSAVKSPSQPPPLVPIGLPHKLPRDGKIAKHTISKAS